MFTTQNASMLRSTQKLVHRVLTTERLNYPEVII